MLETVLIPTNGFKHGSSTRGYFAIVSLPKVKLDIAVFDAKNSTA